MTLWDEVKRAQAEIAKWPKEKRESVRLEGTDPYETVQCPECGEIIYKRNLPCVCKGAKT